MPASSAVVVFPECALFTTRVSSGYLYAIALVVSYREVFALAIFAISSGDLKAAIRHFTQSLEMNPDRESARKGLFYTLSKTGQHEQALKHVNLLKNADAHSAYLAAKSAGALKKSDIETLYLQKAFALGDTDAAWDLSLKILNTNEKARLKKVLQSKPVKSICDDRLYHIGAECVRRNWLDLAEVCFGLVRDSAKENILLACIASELHYPVLEGLAEKHLQLIVMKQNDPKARLSLAEILTKHGKYNKALSLLEPCLADRANREQAMTMRAKIFLVSGADKKAAKEIASLKSIFPKGRYSIDSIQAMISKQIVPNSEIALQVHRSRVKKLADETYSQLGSIKETQKRAGLLQNAARYELLLGDGTKCLQYTSELLAHALDNSDVRN
jgi:tetratricopeptide (TPR) repeat protein